MMYKMAPALPTSQLVAWLGVENTQMPMPKVATTIPANMLPAIQRFKVAPVPDVSPSSSAARRNTAMMGRGPKTSSRWVLVNTWSPTARAAGSASNPNFDSFISM